MTAPHELESSGLFLDFSNTYSTLTLFVHALSCDMARHGRVTAPVEPESACRAAHDLARLPIATTTVNALQ